MRLNKENLSEQEKNIVDLVIDIVEEQDLENYLDEETLEAINNYKNQE